MKKLTLLMLFAGLVVIISCADCTNGAPSNTARTNAADQPALAGQSGVKDETSMPDIVKIAVGSKDHSTLVTALKAANYVDVLSNAGPFTVFAPTNVAFEALPAGTLEGLLKPAKKADLQNILEYHVFVGVIKAENMHEGMKLNQVNLKNVIIHVKDGQYWVNDAKILATVPASNGIVYVIDKVLLPE